MSSVTGTLRFSTSPQDPLILRLLQNLDRLDPGRIEELYHDPMRDEVSFEELVLRSGLADERQIAQAYANHYLLPLFDPPEDVPPPVDASVAALLPASYCRKHVIAPLNDDGQTLDLAIFSPESLLLADEIKAITGRQMHALFAARSVIQRLQADLYRNLDELAEAVTDPSSLTETEEWEQGWEALPDDADVVDAVDDAATVGVHTPDPCDVPRLQANRYLLSLLEQAFHSNASDIHLEPLAGSCRARLRVAGRLTETEPPPVQLLPALVGEIKRLGKMNADDDRFPQDGSIAVRKGKRNVDVRVSTCPTCFGEKVAMRLLAERSVPFRLEALGMGPRQLSDLAEALNKQRGMMLISGPTASGKGTTLYACLHHFNANERSVCTIEDRIRAPIDGVCQLQTRPSEGLSTAAGLRAMLRQDPDVVMVSAVADLETASECLRGVLADQLVLASLAAADAIGGLERLRLWGMDPALLSNTLNLLMSQRLLRRLCDACKEPICLDPSPARRLGLEPGRTVYRARGCARCQGTGYQGRTAVFEVLPVSPNIGDLIRLGKPAREIRETARGEGLALLGDGIRDKLLAGDTTVDEALKLHSA